MAKLKVLHLTYDMRIGGTEMVIKNIIEGSAPDKVEMSIFCIESPLGPWGKELQQSGTAIFCHERQPGFDRSLIKAIRQHLKRQQIDIIQCHQYTPWVYGALAALGLKTKIIFTEHGRFFPDCSSWKRRLINPWLVRATDAVTAISKATKQALVEFEFIPERKIEVIYNGIHRLRLDASAVQATKESLGIPDDAKVVGTVARLDPIKNQVMMVKAFRKVLEKAPNTYLLIVGDGEMRETLGQLVEELSISRQVIFTGYISAPANYIATMDLFLLSSLSEGTSMTLLEAMSLGKPCVVTDAGGNAEIIEHQANGLVSANDDIDDFAQKLAQILSDPTMAQKMSQNAFKRFDDLFTNRQMNLAYQGLYLACVE
ncbi:glycosyltransferase family 4 protein [Neiella marina]|uniref:Glycosyltransferase family 4 protein n=1 Tax=Neiella holothuriorum TaxID=2870530 RepID=A0ABS7EH05_9GAMM|nr:glycosyltransferase family 4 protein [Neiella holothuriorum]MBW8191622.1 glycosyltransferase family 4 protein [Neiella holothuriorum]